VRVPRRVCWRSPRRRLLSSASECSICSTSSSVAQHSPPGRSSVHVLDDHDVDRGVGRPETDYFVLANF
jgi:hypothetical protein